MDWVYLLIAAILEVGWALGIKFTDGFTKLIPSVLTIIGMLFSFFFLSIALRTIPIGTAYAIWTGLGAAGVAVIGILYLNESASLLRIISIILILSGIVGLKLGYYQ